MANIFKLTYKRDIPPDATIKTKRTKDGPKKYARFKKRGGKIVEAELTEDEQKCIVETDEWYIRYKTASGSWKKERGYTDRKMTEAKAGRLEEKVAKKIEGKDDPFEEHHARPLLEHVDDFERHLETKGANTWKHVTETAGKVRQIVEGCDFKVIPDIQSSAVEDYLYGRRQKDLSAQTSNHYVRAIKQFSKWLVTDKRTDKNGLLHLGTVSVSTDRRHDRRALSDDEFKRLVTAAESGKTVEGVEGASRSMLYVLSAWTGFRRAELASLTPRSFALDATPATVTVKAAYSKNSQDATIPLHQDLVPRVREFIEAGELGPDDVLFDLKTSGGYWRKTAKMMREDLEAARKAWIKEVKDNPTEKANREASHFLTYQDEDGLFADFHANRHTFITNLGRAGVPLTTAQKVARHSDPKLTSNIYTHLGVSDNVSAIESLPPPPEDRE